MSLVESLVRGLSGGDGLGKLGQSLGVDGRTAALGLAAAAPMILGALQRNASRPEGAQALADALDRDHDGGVLNDLSAFMGPGDTRGGDAILGQVVGHRRPKVDRGAAEAPGQMGALPAILDVDGDGDVVASDLMSRSGPLLETISNIYKR